MKGVSVGVLALQGGFQKHLEMLQMLKVNAMPVRKPEELKACDALIIPGGESTSIFLQMEFIDFFAALQKFSESKPIFGTCAGLILLSEELLNASFSPLKILNVTVERNAFGRQIDSFTSNVSIELGKHSKQSIPAVFIRAPRIRRTGPEVEILATYRKEPVLVQQGFHLGATFHPELTSDSCIHSYFIDLIKKSKMLIKE